MHANPGSLDSTTLAACLRATAGEERDRQVDFLLYLDAFDARAAYREAGYGSLWEYCLKELALREGAAGRRIGAMRVLRAFPRLEAPLRDGRLSLTTAVTLRPVLTEKNLDEIVARAAYQTDEETRHLVAALQPRAAPREGIRKLPEPALRLPVPASTDPIPDGPTRSTEEAPGTRVVAHESPSRIEAPCTPADEAAPLALTPPRPPGRPTLDPVSADRWSLRVTVDGAFKEELETLRSLLGHKIPDGNLAGVLREAVRCAVEKHGKRRGAVQPARTRTRPPKPRPAGGREPIPAGVRRAVWERDGGRCTYVSPDGRRCESRRQLEFDHVESVALGGRSTFENLRLRCKPHNGLHAEEVFGREYMARFKRAQAPESRTGETTIAGDSAPSVNAHPSAHATPTGATAPGSGPPANSAW
jgi:5-methylcytosine-specific restriction endonuclease McrA